MKHISLGIMGEYKDLGIKLGDSIKVKKEINRIDELLEVNIFIDDQKKDECKISICNELSSMIISIIKSKILKRVVEESYKDVYKEELEHIYACSLNLFNEKESFIKDILFNRVYEYLVNDDYMNINGFVNFRLRDLMDYIIEIRDRGLEEYLLEKDYNEFIGLLKYFVQIQEEKVDLLKIYIEENGTFKLFDKYDRPLENNYTKDIMNLALKENMNYEDFLISTLITICPKEILIYDNLENNISKEIIETIKAIFEGKVEVNYRA